MDNVIKFPLSAYKLSPEEEQRLAESSAFPHGFTQSYWDLCNPKPEMITVEKQEYQRVLRTRDRIEESAYYLDIELIKIKRMTLWDRIFNWPYKEKDDD